MKNFGRPAPDHHQPRRSRRFLELPDVLHQHFRVIHLRSAALHVRPVDPLHVLLIEHRFHRLNGFQRLPQFFQQRRLQNAGIHRRLIRVVFENIPAAEYQILKFRQRNKVLNARSPAFCSLAQPHRSQLRE